MKKSKTWRQLNQGDRDRIQLLWEAGSRQKDIAHILSVHPSRISRELGNRSRQDGRYIATVAEHKAKVARGNSKYQGMKIENNPYLRKHIIAELKQCRSPDEIAGRMIKDKWKTRVSTDAIYRWLRSIFGQRYCKYLCTKRYRKKPHSNTSTRHSIPNMASIHDISPNLDLIAEGDTFLSPKKVSRTAGVLIGWRESRLLKGDLVKSLKPTHTTRFIKKIKSEYTINALILDQGIENREHEQFGIPTYFCDKASPRQKPFIESSIGLLRRWFWPKGTDLSKISKEEFQEKLQIINNKYRKTLHYKSANEVTSEYDILK